MAEDELGPLGTAVLSAIVLGVGLLIILPTALAERRIDLRDSCKPTETGKCFSLENGIVESADSEAVTVLYEDGRKSAKFTLVTVTYPRPGPEFGSSAGTVTSCRSTTRGRNAAIARTAGRM